VPRFFEGPKGRLARERLLIVEGQDDAYFVDRLLADMGASVDEVGVVYLEGKTKLQANLTSLLKSSHYRSGKVSIFAVVGDTDADPQSRLNEIKTAFVANGQPEPASQDFVVNDDGTRVGLFLVPSSTEAGDLEKLCLDTLGGEPLVTDCREFSAGIQGKYGAFREPFKSLAQIYLACRPEDTRGVGRAFYENVFDANHACLDPIKGFLQTFLN
jgi:hypothetical protein